MVDPQTCAGASTRRFRPAARSRITSGLGEEERTITDEVDGNARIVRRGRPSRSRTGEKPATLDEFKQDDRGGGVTLQGKPDAPNCWRASPCS